MIDVLAYLAIVIAFTALGCGHVGQGFPPFDWWRTLRARTGRCATAPEPPAAPARRPVPSWAHTEPYDYEEAA